MAKHNPYFANVIAEMSAKRARATTLLHSAPKLQKIILMIYQEKGPVSFGDMMNIPHLKDQHKLSEEQLSLRLTDLLQAELLIISVSQRKDIFTVPMWAANFIATRINAIRAGEL